MEDQAVEAAVLLEEVRFNTLPVVKELAVIAWAVVVVPVNVWVAVPVPDDITKLLPPDTVKVPLDVTPLVAVINPEMVGVAVQAVPVTVKFPPRLVKLEPETVKVLSKVVAPWRVKAPGVVVEPMVLMELAPDPKVLVVEEPVANVVLPELVKVVKDPAPPVIEPAPLMLPELSITMEGVLMKFL